MSPSRTVATPLTRDEASRYLKKRHNLSYTAATLAVLACKGGGPLFSYSGRFPRYSTEELDTWAHAKMTGAVANTTEGATAKRNRASVGGRRHA